MERKRLFFGNLPSTVNEDQVRDLFGRNGRTVVAVKLVTDPKTGKSRGFGVVDLASAQEVGQAVSELNGSDYDGSTLTVSPARE